MSAYSRPVVVGQSGTPTILERVPLANGEGSQFTEQWLQRVLFECPESLPANDVDPHIGPLIPICMEIETGAGPADILYVTPTGQLVLVETKLWRNPEARRAVVGQILDYAKQLTSWTFDILEEKASLAAGTPSGHLLACLKQRFPEADEAVFVDGVGRSLSTGDFLLLIVGDGIRIGAESLVSFLERFGHMRFGLGLIEVAAFRLSNGDFLLQPRVLAKTEVLQRTVLVGRDGPLALQQSAQAEDTDSAATGQRAWFQSFWAEFLSKLQLEDRSLLPSEPAKSTNQFFSVPPYGGNAWISAYIAQSTKRAGVYLTFAKAYKHGQHIYEMLEADRDAIERETGMRLRWEQSEDRVFLGVPVITFKDLNDPSDRSTVTTFLADKTEVMLRVLRPRLEAAARSIAASNG
jgi:Domain of unknown function (DUF4268)